MKKKAPLIRGRGVQWPQLTVSVAWGASFLCDPSSFSVSGDGPALGVRKGFHELMGVERWAQCLACHRLLLTELSLVSGVVGQEPVQVCGGGGGASLPHRIWEPLQWGKELREGWRGAQVPGMLCMQILLGLWGSQLGGDKTDFSAGVTVVANALLSDDSEPGLSESFTCSH